MDIDLSLLRKVLFQKFPASGSVPDSGAGASTVPEQRIKQDALQAVGELMRQFITETHRRASVEVCTVYSV